MQTDSQKKAFISYEADNWFKRNFEALKKYDAKEDKIISLLKSYNIAPKNVLEIGCSAGYRLDGMRKTFSTGKVVGIEPSNTAIAYGKQNYPEVEFHQGTADDMSCFKDASFDVLIVGFVFYVVDRSLLLRTIAEIDRVLQDNGILIIIDFFTEASVRRNYAHISEFPAFTFKDKYDEIFTATHLYHLLNKSSYNHESLQPDAADDFQNLYTISLLKKSLNAAYK
jgi:ubiquinone/menaquinone biosynthesis C-methylase UbiE